MPHETTNPHPAYALVILVPMAIGAWLLRALTGWSLWLAVPVGSAVGLLVFLTVFFLGAFLWGWYGPRLQWMMNYRRRRKRFPSARRRENETLL